MNSKEFREELVKIMPGYKWTVSRVRPGDTTMIATGIQSSGSNRLSTLGVTRRDTDGMVSYRAQSSGYGTRAPWLHETGGRTLAQALRHLQDHYEHRAATYRAHATDLQFGRKQKGSTQ